MSADVEAIEALVAQIKPMLAGRSPDVQGAVLADLVAIWIAGHLMVGDPEATQLLRGRLLWEHVNCVGRLVPLESGRIHDEQGKVGSPESG